MCSKPSGVFDAGVQNLGSGACSPSPSSNAVAEFLSPGNNRALWPLVASRTVVWTGVREAGWTPRTTSPRRASSNSFSRVDLAAVSSRRDCVLIMGPARIGKRSLSIALDRSRSAAPTACTPTVPTNCSNVCAAAGRIIKSRRGPRRGKPPRSDYQSVGGCGEQIHREPLPHRPHEPQRHRHW